MNNVPKISEAEWEIMRVLWSKAPCTANEVIETLESSTDWSPKTIRTMLNRLVQKNAAAYEQRNRNYAYYPLVTQGECAKSETQTFMKRISGMGLSPWFVHFLKNEKMSPEEIEDLKKILDEKKSL